MTSALPSQQRVCDRVKVALETLLTVGLPEHPSREIYEYALFPTGKLFRPLLAYSLSLDLNPENWNAPKIWNELSNQDIFSAALEIHHVYTLCHDDLPSMDNDDWRRGKTSLHKAYSPWKALLIGDGLLNLSYEALWALDHPQAQKVGRYFSHKLGPQGLIHGQYKDLSQEMKRSFDDLLETHVLKTAHLIEVSLVGALYLSQTQTPGEKTVYQTEKLGKSLGVIFQLLDDLTEMTDKGELSGHEEDVNPWPMNERFQDCLECCVENLETISVLLSELGLEHGLLKRTLSHYFKKMEENILEGEENINAKLPKGKTVQRDLRPLMTALNRLCKL